MYVVDKGADVSLGSNVSWWFRVIYLDGGPYGLRVEDYHCSTEGQENRQQRNPKPYSYYREGEPLYPLLL
jgi:hypothetical protein